MIVLIGFALNAPPKLQFESLAEINMNGLDLTLTFSKPLTFALADPVCR